MVLASGVALTATLVVTVSLVAGVVAALATPGVAVTTMSAVETATHRALGRRWATDRPLPAATLATLSTE